MPGRKTAPLFKSGSSQWNSNFSRSDTPCLVCLHLRKFHPAIPQSLVSWELFPLALDCCSKCLVFETTTDPKLRNEILVNILYFLERYLLQSEELNLVQSQETTQCRRWRLRKSCCFTAEKKCIEWQRIWNFS